MNPFVDIQLNVQGYVITVQYKINPLFDGPGPYTFNLVAYQDETFTNSLYSIAGTGFFIVDDTATRQNQLANFLYKLSLTTLDGKVYMSDFFGWHADDHVNKHKYLLASEITRRERVRFNYAGLYTYLLKRKSYSISQPDDVDIVTGEPIVDNTSTFGVGALGGYYDPVLTRVSIENKETKTDYSEDGRGSQFIEILSTRSIGFPFIDQHDILVMGDGKRFTVTDSNSTYFPGTTMIIIQRPSIRLIPNTDTVYNIPVPDFPKI